MSAHIPGGAEQRRAERKARPDEARTYHSVICKTAAAVSGMRHGGTGGAFKLLHSTRASTECMMPRASGHASGGYSSMYQLSCTSTNY